MENIIRKTTTHLNSIKWAYTLSKTLAIGSIGVYVYLNAAKTWDKFLDAALHDRLSKLGVQEFTLTNHGRSEKIRLSNADLSSVEALIYQTQYEAEQCAEKLTRIENELKQ